MLLRTKGVTLLADDSVMDGDNIARDRYCSANVTIENCHAILLHFKDLKGAVPRLMVWRKDTQRPKIKCEAKKRVRDLRTGDVVVVEGRIRKIIAVEIYR